MTAGAANRTARNGRDSGQEQLGIHTESVQMADRRSARYWVAAATIISMVVVQAIVIRQVAGDFGSREAAVVAATLVVALGVGFWVVMPFVEQLRVRISETEESLERLRYSEARYRALFAEVPVGIVLVDPRRSVIVAGNLAAARKMGYESAADLDELDFLPHTVEDEYVDFVS